MEEKMDLEGGFLSYTRFVVCRSPSDIVKMEIVLNKDLVYLFFYTATIRLGDKGGKIC
jgi:hypothetical protein